MRAREEVATLTPGGKGAPTAPARGRSRSEPAAVLLRQCTADHAFNEPPL